MNNPDKIFGLSLNDDDEQFSILQKLRVVAEPSLPTVLKGPVKVLVDTDDQLSLPDGSSTLSQRFPSTWGMPLLQLVPDADIHAWATHQPLRLGILLSGSQAPGGHNVIAGVYDYLKKCNPNSQLFGFLNGPSGLCAHQYVEVNDALMNRYRNLGGFDMLRSGRQKIETEEQKQMCLQVVKKLDLHGLVMVGGDDTNANAAILAEYLKSNGSSANVIGVPKTVEGDIRNKYVEASFGFDTAVKIYSEFVGNLATDIATSRKYYHLIRLMGRSTSNITLHVALLTRPNLTFIGEEVQAKKQSLNDLVQELVDLVVKRQDAGKDFGIVLVPEGLLEFVPEIRLLIDEINNILAAGEFDVAKLTTASADVFNLLPLCIRDEFFSMRDPHGNVIMTGIPAERVLIVLARDRLMKLGRADAFVPRSHYFGYEGRAGMPSLFDSNYCCALGRCAAALVDAGCTGYMATVRNLAGPVAEWLPGGCPFTRMMEMQPSKGRDEVPAFKKYFVELDKTPFTLFAEVREAWRFNDLYANPGPIQFEGPCAELVNFSIRPPTRDDLLPERAFGFEALKSRAFFPKSYEQLSGLQRDRLTAPVQIPLTLMDSKAVLGPRCKFDFCDPQTEAAITRTFPVQCRDNKALVHNVVEGIPAVSTQPLRVGVFLNGQQASGVANVLIGLWERLTMLESPRGRLFGFLDGIHGVMSVPPRYIEITKEDLALSRNQGGFELLGREKAAEMLIATSEGLDAAERVCTELRLDGLVMIGGRWTLTGVTVLAEQFLRKGIRTRVIGVPATQNNNVDTSIIESSLGFDSSSKCYNYLTANLSTDGASSARYWLFIRLMGADKSHISVEVGLSTHPNVTLVSEAYVAGDKTLYDVVADVSDTVVNRASQGLYFGTILIPEGLISSLPQFRQLISELKLLFGTLNSVEAVKSLMKSLVKMDASAEATPLSPWSKALLKTLPESFREQLIDPRELEELEPLTKVATEKLLAEMVAIELRRREKAGLCSRFSFIPLCFYFGYQGRSSLPSKFDCSLGLAHGYLAALAVRSNVTSYITCLRGLAATPSCWIPTLYPSTAFLRLPNSIEQELYPQKVPMAPSDMVRLSGKAFQKLTAKQQQWEREDRYCNSGPIQFSNCGAAYATTSTLVAEHKDYLDMLPLVNDYIGFIRKLCGGGASETVLQISVATLSMLHRLHKSGRQNPFN